MKGLLADFEALFDLSYPVRDRPLRELVEQTLESLDAQPRDDWGTVGPREEVVTESEGLVSLHYRPHLFPGMDPKLRLAHELQFGLLPEQLPPAAPLSIAAVLESYCHLSGDLFGWDTLRDGRFLLWIVDMSGHGVDAGLCSAVLKLVIDNLRERGKLTALVAELNRAMHDCLRPGRRVLYATGFFMALRPDGHGSYCSAGHPPVMLRRADGRVEELASLDPPIGMFADTTYQYRPIQLDPGDVALLYTDGLIEATGYDGQPFGLERLRGLVADESGAPERLTGRIYNEVARRQDVDKLEDDITFIAAKREGQ